MSNTNATVEAITDRMESTLTKMGGTPSGSDWCMAALDPYHDTELENLRGFPDGTGNASIVQVVSETFTIGAPTGLTTTTWDCHASFWPWLDRYNVQLGDFLERSVTSNTSTSLQPVFIRGTNNSTVAFGGLTVSSGNSGYTDLFANGAASFGALSNSTICPDPAFLQGEYRVIGQAFEFRSVGPDLYKSGSSWLWRQPIPEVASATTGIWATQGTGSANSFSTFMTVDLPPQTAADVQLIPSTVMLNAKEGAYVVSRFNTVDPPRVDNNAVTPILLSGVINTAVTASTGDNIFIAFGGLSSTTAFVPSTNYTNQINRQSCVNASNFDLTGAFIQGLNPQDVLTFSVRWIIERFPSIEEKSILVLAKAPPCYDPIAIEAYSRIVCHLPVGVPVRENSIGDWFRQAAGALTKIAAPILKQIPHPYAQAASKVIGTASKALTPTIVADKPKKPNPAKAMVAMAKLQAKKRVQKKTK